MIVIASKIGVLPDVGVFSLLATVFLIWMAADGVRHRNFFEMIFAAAFLYIIYDKPLEIEVLTPWTVLAVALMFSIGLSLLFGGKREKKHSIEFEWAHIRQNADLAGNDDHRHHDKKDAPKYFTFPHRCNLFSSNLLINGSGRRRDWSVIKGM